uniref:protein-L-isoaspartate(D-aspartate) O-methyltransferase n=1 Tax=Polytomella parva TaxID=51329 RepID=A0A7S0YKS6_9CHLO|mmetsp:Transcript_31282/g.56779  ORF Transcript_31282/g.56779 Transcript_31282/m.56779 type:complete len:303 (+) Transcript_31282:132-1040(+)
MKSFSSLLFKTLQNERLVKSKIGLATVRCSSSFPSFQPSRFQEAVTHDQLMNTLSERLINEPAVAQVMRVYDRKYFATPYPNYPFELVYKDEDITLCFGQTITSPSLHAVTLDTLFPYLTRPTTETRRVLDIGAGTGYLTACMSHLVRAHDIVVYVDALEDMVLRARRSLAEAVLAPRLLMDRSLRDSFGDGSNVDVNKIYNIHLLMGNAMDMTEAFQTIGKFDVINVGASVQKVPSSFLDILAPGGALLIPVGLPNTSQNLTLFEKSQDGETVSERVVCEAAFSTLAPADVGSMWKLPPVV